MNRQVRINAREREDFAVPDALPDALQLDHVLSLDPHKIGKRNLCNFVDGRS